MKPIGFLPAEALSQRESVDQLLGARERAYPGKKTAAVKISTRSAQKHKQITQYKISPEGDIFN